MPMPASSSTARPPARMAGVSENVQRCETKGCSWQSAPACGKTQRSSGTPSARARSTEHMITAAAWSTSLLLFMYFGYGSPIMRLAGPGVRISSAVFACWTQAYGLSAATCEKRAQSRLIFTWCSSTPSAAAARSAVSNIG